MKAPVVKKYEVYQSIDLQEFGLEKISKKDLEHIGEIAIDFMKKRIASGVGYNGFDLKSVPYSKDYKESLAFKAWGKRPSKVNMKLTGDLLELMDVIGTEKSELTIGWDSELQNKKSFNHNYGDTLPKRKFFGLNKKEMAQIIKQFKKETSDAKD